MGVLLWLLENTHYAETFRVAMGRVGGAVVGCRWAWASNQVWARTIAGQGGRSK